jgi:uncharacterized membrane protein
MIWPQCSFSPTTSADNARVWQSTKGNLMHTPASIGKHPIHPMLIVFPIGLWVFSLACDFIRVAGASGDARATVAFYAMVGGLIGALCAAVPGFIDLLYYKGARRRSRRLLWRT